MCYKNQIKILIIIITGCTHFTRHKHGIQSLNNSNPYRYKEKVKGIIPRSACLRMITIHNDLQRIDYFDTCFSYHSHLTYCYKCGDEWVATSLYN